MEDIYSASDTAAATDTVVKRPWLITFANLVCILLSIFVLLAHSSSVQKERVEQAISSLGSSLAFGSLIEARLKAPESAGEAMAGPEALRERLGRRIKMAFPNVKILELPPGVILRVALPESDVFAGAGLSPPVIEVLGVIAEALKTGAPGYRLEIETVVAAPDPAATDMPIARASTLARELVARGAPKPTVITGIAPKPAGDVVLTMRARRDDEPAMDFGRLVPEP
jgi:Membrane MotB of proton-channel complex MotA/MotB